MPNIPYAACIFDLDGTLANTLESIAYFGNGALAAFGLPPIEPLVYRRLVGNGADLLMKRMLAQVGATLSPADVASFRAEYDRLYESDPMKLVAPYPGLPQLLEELRGQGIKLGVLSNKPDNMTRFITGELYGSLVHQVHGQRQGIPTKPDPTALLAMAEELMVRPQEVLYIGDSGVDMDTGRNAGMDTCGVLWGFREREELERHGAKYLAATGEELARIIYGRQTRQE